MTWSLVTFLHNGTAGVAVLRQDGKLVAPMEFKRWATMLELVSDWAVAEGILRGLDIEDAPVIEHEGLLAPLQWPRNPQRARIRTPVRPRAIFPFLKARHEKWLRSVSASIAAKWVERRAQAAMVGAVRAVR